MEARRRLLCSLVALVLAAATSAPSGAEDDDAPEVRLPADVTYRGGEDSPGPVVFSHTTHVPLADDRCTGCHPALFPILRPTGKVTHAEMEAGRKCGACHNGVEASGIEEECENCHQEDEQP